MEALAQKKFFQRLHLATNRHICPECGQKMAEVQRQRQQDFLFIWYECPVEDCMGQWLQKYPLEKKAF